MIVTTKTNISPGLECACIRDLSEDLTSGPSYIIPSSSGRDNATYLQLDAKGRLRERDA